MLRPLSFGEKEIYKYLLSCVNAVMNGKPCPKAKNGASYDTVLSFARFCSVSNILGYGFLMDEKFKDIIDKETYDKFIYDKIYFLMKDTNQYAEMEKFRCELAKSQIDSILIKGFFIKEMFPQTDFRQSVDIDLYCKKSDFTKIKAVANDLSYKVLEENERVIVLCKEPFTTIEIHSNLDFANTIFTKNLFCYAKKSEEHLYYLSDEDHYIYIFEHLAKHFSVLGGVGIKSLLDVLVLSKKLKPRLDEKYLNRCFEKNGLKEFEKELINRAEKLLKNLDFNFDVLDEYMLSSGTFGTEDAQSVGEMIYYNNMYKVNHSNRFIYTINRLFPPFSRMKELYPRSCKNHLLLPFLWIFRILSYLCCGNKLLYRNRLNKYIKNASKEERNIYYKIMSLAGL